MIRRRRAQREIAFSFDSFLDVVANVVGIILRLILVAWVGARSYQALVPAPTPPVVADDPVAALPAPTDPLADELPKKGDKLTEAESRWQQKVRQCEEAEQQAAVVRKETPAIEAQAKQLDAEIAARNRAAGIELQAKQGTAAASLADVLQRKSKAETALAELDRMPSQKQTLRYPAPISQPLQTEELMFECHGGKVVAIDVGTLIERVRQGMRDKGDLLRSQRQVQDETAPAGAFRARYIIERGRDPGAGVNVAAWEVIPVDSARGETVDQALAPGSAFRKVIDALEPQQTAVTFWVYPDSFALYRRLRDVLHDHDVTVAGRPLPEGHPIAFSSNYGTVSRGQ